MDVQTIWYCPQVTLLPALAGGHRLADWWLREFTDAEPGSLLCMPADDPDYLLCFSVPQSLNDLLSQQYPDNKSVHGLARLKPAEREAHVRADFCGHNLLLLASAKQRLLFANQFRFDHTHDVVYFILALYHQYRLAHDSVPLTLSGDVTEDSAVVQLLRRYLRHVQFARLPAGTHVGDDYRLPHHFFFTLLAA